MKAEQPFFSIITPTYNRAHFLPEMLASVKQQLFSNFEHIIIDDGSSDGTEQLMAKFLTEDARLKYIRQENKGRSAARNVGIDAANGKFVCFLDSDDYWSKNYLEGLQKVISRAEAPMLATRMVWVDMHSGRETLRAVEDINTLEPQKVIELEYGMNVCISKAVLGEDRFNEKLFVNEDFELWMRVFCCSEISIKACPDSLYYVNIHDNRTPSLSLNVIEGMIETQQIMRTNVRITERTPLAFWLNRSQSLDLKRIRFYEQSYSNGRLSLLVLKYLFMYPETRQNKSLWVSLLYNLPGGPLLKRLIASTKTTAR